MSPGAGHPARAGHNPILRQSLALLTRGCFSGNVEPCFDIPVHGLASMSAGLGSPRSAATKAWKQACWYCAGLWARWSTPQGLRGNAVTPNDSLEPALAVVWPGRPHGGPPTDPSTGRALIAVWMRGGSLLQRAAGSGATGPQARSARRLRSRDPSHSPSRPMYRSWPASGRRATAPRDSRPWLPLPRKPEPFAAEVFIIRPDGGGKTSVHKGRALLRRGLREP